MVEVQCAWLRPIRACNQPGCQRKQTGREPHGWLIHMHATRPGWPACRDPRPRGAPASPDLLGTLSNEPGANEHIYLCEREAWHGVWKEAAGRTEPAWKPASSTPNPPRGRQGVSLLRASVFLGYEKGVKEIEAQGRWNHTPRLSFQFAREPFARGPVTLRAHVTLSAGVWSLGGQTPVFGEGRVARCGAFPSGLCPFANGVGPGTAPDSASLSLPLCKTGMITRPYVTELLKELLHVERLA